MMMADLEKKEHGNISKSNYWVQKAKSATLDYSWGCTSCTYVSKSWSLICPKCNNVYTIKWQQFSPSQITLNSQRTRYNRRIEYWNRKVNLCKSLLYYLYFTFFAHYLLLKTLLT